MFTKEITITLPLMVLLYEFSFLKTKKGFDWAYLFPFMLAIFIIPITMFFTVSGHSISSQEIEMSFRRSIEYFLKQYLSTQFRVVCTYIRLVFLPINQNLDYDYSISKSIFEWPAFLSFLFLMAILFFAQRLFLKYRLLSFSIFWFFLTLLPESSLFPIQDVIFEHRLYLPLVGYSIFLVSGVYYLLGKNAIKTMVIVLTMIIAVIQF